MISTRVDDGRPTHYEILGVVTTASTSEIKDAYYAAARIHHPDRQRPTVDGNHTTSVSSTLFLLIQKAWECLRDAKTRQQYDQSLLLQSYRANRLYQNAIRIQPSDCREVMSHESMRDYSNRVDMDDDNYIDLIYQCRCGSDINTSQASSIVSSGTNQDPTVELTMDLVQCPGCSLIYDVGLIYMDEDKDAEV